MKATFLYPLVLCFACIITSCHGTNGSYTHQKNDSLPLAKNTVSIRVMTFNIHHANPPGQGNKIDLQSIANLIKKHQPDLVALQEVDVNTNRSQQLNQPKILADKLNMQVRFGKTIDYDGGAYGLAVLSKLPIQKQHILKLPQEDTNAEPRILQSIFVSLPNGISLRLGNTHLNAQKENTSRLLQVQQIINAAKISDLPFILLGDLNATPNSTEITMLNSIFTPTCQSCTSTYPADKPQKIIDYTNYYSKKVDVKVVSHKVIPSQISDHRPVLVEFTISPI